MLEFHIPHLRLKLALSALLGAMLTLLPLSQVLRLQDAEIVALATERAQLDPLALAVDLQRGLLGHRDVTDRVLQGRSALQPERLHRQHDVEAALAQLQATLYAGYWQRALSESSSLGVDWRSLIARIEALQIDRDDNQHAHRLLIEQSVQVMDDVAALAPPGSVAPLVAGQARALLSAGTGADRSAAVAGPSVQALQQTLAQHVARLAEQQASAQQQATGIVIVLALVLLLLTLALVLLSPPWRGPPGAEARVVADGMADDNRRSTGRRLADQPQSAGLRSGTTAPTQPGHTAPPGNAAADTVPAGFTLRSRS